VNEVSPILTGVEPVGYAENFHIVKVPNINEISTSMIDKYGIRIAPSYVEEGIKFYIATKDSAKLYKNYSSASEPDFFDEEFDVQRGIRIKRPMTDNEVTARYQTIRWLRIQLVNEYYKQRFVNLTINKTPQEQATWSAQSAEAQAYILDNTVATPVLSSLAEARGETVESLANKVINAITNYNNSIVELFAEQEGYITALKNAEGDDVINTLLPFDRTVIPGDSRFESQTFQG
jgi:hypothetical protein